MENKTIIPIFIMTVLVLCFAFCTRVDEKQEPVEYKDDNRIAVRIKTDVITDAWKQYAPKEEWGKMESPWWQLFNKEFKIEASQGQYFYEILNADSAAIKIAADYPELFEYEQKGDKCTLTMKCEKNGNFIVMPTWILGNLIQGGVLNLPN